MAPHSSTLAWKIPWVEKPGGPQSVGSLRVGQDSATSLSLFTFHFPALEKEMATHSSVLAWRIPGTGEPGGLPSMGSHRVDTTEVTQQQQQYLTQKYDFKSLPLFRVLIFSSKEFLLEDKRIILFLRIPGFYENITASLTKFLLSPQLNGQFQKQYIISRDINNMLYFVLDFAI